MLSDAIWPAVIGQSRVKRTLLRAMKSGRLPHAFLFYGHEGTGKDAMAIEFARVMHCEEGRDEACGRCASCAKMKTLQHPDVRFITALPVGKNETSEDQPLAKLTDAEVKAIQEQLRLKGVNPYHRIAIPRANIIKINSIRAVRRESSMSTSGRGKRIFIIARAEEMGEHAAHTILKTLEEPPGDTMLILTTARREALLPTIVSRCQNLRFDPLLEEDIRDALLARENVDVEQATLVARLAHGSYAYARDLLQEDIAALRADVVDFIRHLLAPSIAQALQDVERIGGTKDRDIIRHFLNLMLMWFRDALVLSKGGEVINLDQQDDLKKFIARFGASDFSRILSALERSLSLVDKNVYIALVLLELMVQLRSAILSPRDLRDQSLGQSNG